MLQLLERQRKCDSISTESIGDEQQSPIQRIRESVRYNRRYFFGNIIFDLGAVVIFGVLVVIIVMMLLYRKGRKKRRQAEEERMRRIRGAQARSIAARRTEKRKRGRPY